MEFWFVLDDNDSYVASFKTRKDAYNYVSSLPNRELYYVVLSKG